MTWTDIYIAAVTVACLVLAAGCATFGLAATRRTRRQWTETDDAAYMAAVAEYRGTP